MLYGSGMFPKLVALVFVTATFSQTDETDRNRHEDLSVHQVTRMCIMLMSCGLWAYGPQLFSFSAFHRMVIRNNADRCMIVFLVLRVI